MAHRKAERRAAADPPPPPAKRKSSISDALRWMDSAEEPADTVGQGKKPLRVSEGGKAKKKERTKPLEESTALEPPRTKKLTRPSQEQLESSKRESRAGKVADARQPALEPPRTRTRPSAEERVAPAAKQPDPGWGKSARPPRSETPPAEVDRALSWMDSAEERPLPPEARPKTAKVEAVLGWMDDLAGPFEDVVQGPRKKPAKPASAEPAPKRASEEKRASDEKRGRPPTGALKREAVDALLARADQVKRPTGRVSEAAAAPPCPFEDSSPDALAAPARPADLGEYGPLSASDVWLLAQSPEDVMRGARRPLTETTALPPPPPPLPSLARPAAPVPASPPSPPRMQARPVKPPAPPQADRRAKVEELLEWTQDLLGALGSDSSLEALSPGDVIGGSDEQDGFAPPLSLVGEPAESSSDDHSPLPPLPPLPPVPPTRSSSRLLRLQEQLAARAKLESTPAPGWAARPDPGALARLQRAALETFGHQDSSDDAIPIDPMMDSMEADPYAAVFPPVNEAPRDPRCKDPFCVDPRCRLGASPAETGSSDERPAAWPTSGTWSRENRPRIIRPPGVA